MRSLLLFFLLPAAAHAVTLTLGASKDNSLYQDSLGGLSNGSGPTLFLGATGGGGIRRGLLEFDLSAIPAGSIVESVSLRLFLVQAQSFPTAVTLHTALAEWGEGASSAGNRGGGGASATPNDATWIHAFYQNAFWANAGGDFTTAASATTIVGGEGAAYVWNSSAAFVANIQAWVNEPGANHGWVLRGDETQSTTAKAFATRENSTVANRPSLTVTYTPIPEPGAFLSSIAGLLLLCGARRSRCPRRAV